MACKELEKTMAARSQNVIANSMETFITSKLNGNEELKKAYDAILVIANEFADNKRGTYKLNKYHVLLAATLSVGNAEK
mgnify:CR=1 FL=1